MSTIKIADICLWPAHIDGNPELRERLISLADGELVVLKIGKTSGTFRKMVQGKNPRPTSGLKLACDATRAWWTVMFSEQKDARLPIREVAR